MAALVCDLCGGKLVMGAGGIATCDSCGMEHSSDRMKEKIQEIKGVVRVDNTHMIDNYLEMANKAYRADNNSEAESYCNKIIEIDPTNAQAWMLKGKAAAWQSTLQNSRVSEGVTAFVKAINNAPEDEKENYVDEAKDQIKSLAVAMIQLRANRFAKWPDEEEANGFIADITSILSTVVSFLKQTGVLISISEIMAPVAVKINASVVKAWQDVIWPDYNGDPNDSNDRANKYEWQKFIKRVGYCTSLIEKAIGLCDEDDEDDIQRYENLIFMHKAAIDSCAWDYNITSYGRSWYKNWELTDEAKSYRRDRIREFEDKIRIAKTTAERKKKEAAQKRFNDYWAEHADDKIALEAERRELEAQVAELKAKINNIPGTAEKANIQQRIEALTAEKNSLGLFKGKEKKALQEKIDAANIGLKRVSDRIDAVKMEIEKKIEPLQRRINDINTELTKAR